MRRRRYKHDFDVYFFSFFFFWQTVSARYKKVHKITNFRLANAHCIYMYILFVVYIKCIWGAFFFYFTWYTQTNENKTHLLVRTHRTNRARESEKTQPTHNHIQFSFICTRYINFARFLYTV